MANLVVLDELTNRLHATQKTIRKIDTKKPIGTTGGRYSLARFGGCATQRFLTKNAAASSGYCRRLGGVERAWRSNHDTLEVLREKVIEGVAPCRTGRQTKRLFGVRLHRIDNRRNLY
jgi:hypothetical protein